MDEQSYNEKAGTKADYDARTHSVTSLIHVFSTSFLAPKHYQSIVFIPSSISASPTFAKQVTNNPAN